MPNEMFKHILLKEFWQHSKLRVKADLQRSREKPGKVTKLRSVQQEDKGNVGKYIFY